MMKYYAKIRINISIPSCLKTSMELFIISVLRNIPPPEHLFPTWHKINENVEQEQEEGGGRWVGGCSEGQIRLGNDT